jgi:tripeptide aminopeptidase
MTLLTLCQKRNTETTKGYEGFFHVHHLTGSIEETVLELIIRDHSKLKFEKRKELIEKIAAKINKKFASNLEKIL